MTQKAKIESALTDLSIAARSVALAAADVIASPPGENSYARKQAAQAVLALDDAQTAMGWFRSSTDGEGSTPIAELMQPENQSVG